MPDGHPDVQFGRLEFQVFGRFGIPEQDPFVFMPQIAVRIDVLFHAAAAFSRFDTILSVKGSSGLRSHNHILGLYNLLYSFSFFINGFDSRV